MYVRIYFASWGEEPLGIGKAILYREYWIWCSFGLQKKSNNFNNYKEERFMMLHSSLTIK